MAVLVRRVGVIIKVNNRMQMIWPAQKNEKYNKKKDEKEIKKNVKQS